MDKKPPQRISNYHLDLEIRGEQLFIDYKLKLDIYTHFLMLQLGMKIGK